MIAKACLGEGELGRIKSYLLKPAISLQTDHIKNLFSSKNKICRILNNK